jgi:hypothetical protein
MAVDCCEQAIAGYYRLVIGTEVQKHLNPYGRLLKDGSVFLCNGWLCSLSPIY